MNEAEPEPCNMQEAWEEKAKEEETSRSAPH